MRPFVHHATECRCGDEGIGVCPECAAVHEDAIYASGVADERARCIALINHAREEGETDLRQVRNWIESGKTAEELAGDS